MLRQVLIDLAILTGIGVVLSIVGPFGTFALPFAVRLVVWVGAAWLGYALYGPIDAVARRLAPRLDLPAMALRVVGVLVASVPMAALVWIAGGWPDPRMPASLEAGLVHYAYVAVIGAVITGSVALLGRRTSPLDRRSEVGPQNASPPESETEPPPTPAGPRLLDRLPPALGKNIIALENEDHYVRIHTPAGSELVLMRLADAIAEMDGADGAQVHRGWWVARSAVTDVSRDGRRVRLSLENGLDVPVSRANVAALRAAGWLGAGQSRTGAR